MPCELLTVPVLLMFFSLFWIALYTYAFTTNTKTLLSLSIETRKKLSVWKFDFHQTDLVRIPVSALIRNIFYSRGPEKKNSLQFLTIATCFAVLLVVAFTWILVGKDKMIRPWHLQCEYLTLEEIQENLTDSAGVRFFACPWAGSRGERDPGAAGEPAQVPAVQAYPAPAASLPRLRIQRELPVHGTCMCMH
jgi:hypothetical protein